MAEDADTTVRTLAAYRDEIALLVRQHRGRVVDSPGDNLLAEFPSAVRGVEAAVPLPEIAAELGVDALLEGTVMRDGERGATRHIPAAIKRAVAERDGGRCTFVARDGRRCDSRDSVEFHHTQPFARSRRHRAEEIALRCRAHNRHAAIQDYGAEHMARFWKQDACHLIRSGASSPVGGARGGRALV